MTRRGKPVAVVVSSRTFERLSSERPRFGDAYRRFLQTYSLDDVGLDDDFAAAARDQGVGRKTRL